MKVVIFGGGGQLGQELSRAGWSEGLLPICPIESEADITEAISIERTVAQPEVGFVINAAAYTAVDKAESEHEQAFRVNRDGAANIARICAARRMPMLHVSTDYVFDGTKQTAYAEDDPVCPLGVYGESKASGETAVRENLAEHLIVRTSWLFSSFGQNFVKTMLRLAAERDRLRVVADQFGRPTPAADLAAAIAAIVARFASGQSFPWGTYHFAGAGRASWHELAVRTVELQAPYTRKSPTVDPITSADYPTPAKRPQNSALDTSKYERVFGRAPRPWQIGLKEVVDELLGPGRA